MYVFCVRVFGSLLYVIMNIFVIHNPKKSPKLVKLGVVSDE